MFGFILLSLALGYWVQAGAPLTLELAAPVYQYIGLGVSLFALIFTAIKKGRFKWWYDLFASGALLTWFSYWKPLFNDDSPMFFFFPVYFAAMTAFFSLALIEPCGHLDNVSLNYMRRFAVRGIQPWAVMAGTLGSLLLTDHYLVFPVMVTLLLLRFALDCCIERSRNLPRGQT